MKHLAWFPQRPGKVSPTTFNIFPTKETLSIPQNTEDFIFWVFFPIMNIRHFISTVARKEQSDSFSQSIVNLRKNKYLQTHK